MRTLITLTVLFQIPIIMYGFSKFLYFYTNNFERYIGETSDVALMSLRYGGVFESLITMMISIMIVLVGYAILKNLDEKD